MDSGDCKTKIYRPEYKKIYVLLEDVKGFLKPERDKKGEKRWAKCNMGWKGNDVR